MHYTLQRHCSKNPKQIFPEMKLRGFVPSSYTHESVSYVYISTYFAAAKQVDQLWEYINRSQIHECGNCCSKIGGPTVEIYKSLTDILMWKLGTRPRSFISGKHKSNLVCNVKPKILWTCMEFRQVIIRQQLFLLVNCKHLRALVIKPYLSAVNCKQSYFSKKYSFHSALHTQYIISGEL